MMSMSDEKSTWGTWEELLLACAVKRHGFKNWDSVAMEIQTKTSLPQLQTTAQCCKHKYHDLKHRFKAAAIDNIPWLEQQLRKVRVDELKQEVRRYDLSILSLQLKVKRLEEERDNQQKPDLENHKTSLNDKSLNDKSEDKPIIKLLTKREEDSEGENRSVNESNSEEGEGGDLMRNEPEPVRSGGEGGGIESESKGAVGEESEEMGDSVTQLSSDVQSSVSLGRKRKRKRKRKKDSGDAVKETDLKSEPLIWLLEMIRTHKHVSMFERRLKSQDSNYYKQLIRQHLDLETIQTRIQGSSYYSSCTILTFYRDLLLLFNNAIVYFPKSSLESQTALQLRNLLSNEIKKETNLNSHSSQQLQVPPLPPQSKPVLPTSDSLLANHNSSPPIIVCRKRSSVSAKTSSSFAQNNDTDHQPQQQNDDDDDTDKKPATDQKPQVQRSLLMVKTEEKKPVITGARSSRRSSRNLTNSTPTTLISNGGNHNGAAQCLKGGASGSAVKQETPKTDKKKTETSDKKKSVVDFLKRIKKNSPVQTAKKSNKGGNKCNGTEEQKRNNNNSTTGKKEDKGKERVSLRSSEKKEAKEETSPSKRSVGRPPKKSVEASKVSGKRGRESGGKDKVAAKRQSKRATR